MQRLALPLLLLPMLAYASDEYTLTLRGHRFEPAEIHLPAGQKIKLTIDNRDASAEEFESHALNREKVIPGNARGVVFVGPLVPGRYDFVGEFNATTAHGLLIVD